MARYAGYCVDFNTLVEEKKIDALEIDPPLLPIDSLILLDNKEKRITTDVISRIKETPIFVAVEHARQGSTSDELLMWKNKKPEYDAILKGILIHSTKKYLHILGYIFINGEQLHIVMYNNSSIHNFELKKRAVLGHFGKPIPLPTPIKFKCIPHCQ